MNRLLLAALLVLAGLEVVLVASADDGGVTARLVEEPLAEGLLSTLFIKAGKEEVRQYLFSLRRPW